MMGSINLLKYYGEFSENPFNVSFDNFFGPTVLQFYMECLIAQYEN